MNYQHLNYFRTVARCRTFQEAADKLYITQPTLSRAISALEDEIGLSLFEKSGRNVKITPYGSKFLEYVENALDTIDDGIDELHIMAGRIDGTLNVACIYGYTYNYLPTVLHGFGELYPSVSFYLKQTTTQDAIYQVHAGEADIGIHGQTSFMEKYQDLEYYPVIEEEVVAAVASTHPLASRDSCSLSDLMSESLISFDLTSSMYYRTREMFSEAGLEFTPFMYVSDDQSILNIVRSGKAVALVLHNTTDAFKDLIPVKIKDDINKQYTIYCAIRKNRRNHPALDKFVEYLTESYSPPSDI